MRSLLVPALSYDLGRVVWWPSKLWRAGMGEPGRADDATVVEAEAPSSSAQYEPAQRG